MITLLGFALLLAGVISYLVGATTPLPAFIRYPIFASAVSFVTSASFAFWNEKHLNAGVFMITVSALLTGVPWLIHVHSTAISAAIRRTSKRKLLYWFWPTVAMLLLLIFCVYIEPLKA
ncbi:hypothetical protein GCM10027347_52710 [Larkinella harenae]